MRNTPIKENEMQEVLSFMASLKLHEGDMRNAILNQDEEAMKKAYENMRYDLDNICLWLYGGQCANLNENDDLSRNDQREEE